ncbi:MAG: flagellar biosynthesis protein FlhF, partial [Campylobacterota bacterium]|nr:flagellar biosynthesis protein FlhF [Campylobacterota bacterium]
MKLYTFTGETPAEALKKAQLECGEDALVVNTKEIRKRTINSPALYEVVVASEENEKKPSKETIQKSEKSYIDTDDVLLNLSETVKQITKIAQITEKDPVEKKEEKREEKEKESLPKIIQSNDNMHLKDIQQEIGKLTDKVKLIQNMIWDTEKQNRSGISIPPEFAEIYRIAKSSGMLKEHIEEIMRLTLEHMPLSMRQNSTNVKRYFNVLLRKLTTIRI